MGEVNDPLYFSDEWYSLGIVTEQKYQELLTQFQSGEDQNPEHYRWLAFRGFLARNDRLSEQILRRIYHLGESDPDWHMGGDTMARILQRLDCPADLLREGSMDTSRKHLIKIARGRI